MQHTLAYRNGKFLPKNEITIGIDDLGFERGFAVFDYCRQRNGKITFLSDHMQRLAHSQSVLNLQHPVEMESVEHIITELQKVNTDADGYYKIIVSAKMDKEIIEPVLTIYHDSYTPYPPDDYEQGIALILHEFDKPFADYKTTFYMGSLREYERMKTSGAEDVLFYFDNNIRECARCNIFMVKGNAICTPDKNMLKGVTRKHVMACAKENFFVLEQDITVEELFEAEEVFITSTTKNMMPVTRIEDKLIGSGKPGAITKVLMEQFELYCNNYATE